MWPPVMPSAGPETCMCGPGMWPSSISSRRATSVKSFAPTLRTVVKPASRVVLAFSTPKIASLPGVMESSKYGSKSVVPVR